jgi:hypothetical protein
MRFVRANYANVMATVAVAIALASAVAVVLTLSAAPAGGPRLEPLASQSAACQQRTSGASSRGSCSVRGERGPRGPRGARGPAGPAGPAGPRGERGLTGPPGAPGPQGPQGEQGPPGEDGEEGATGRQGPPGEDGVDGQDGEDGVDGQDGATGPRGPSDAYVAESEEDATLAPDGSLRGVGTQLDLPAGQYVLSARALESGTGSGEFTCVLLGPTGTFDLDKDSRKAVLSGVADLPEGGRVALLCGSDTSGRQIGSRQIVAIKVAELH